MDYYVYLVKCADKSYYCGYTTDLERRVKEHNDSEKGAKYTSGRRPVTLKYFEKHESLSSALKREHEIKQLSHKEKKNLTVS